MCSECGEDHERFCFFCGIECYGHCEDEDTCPSCWPYKNDPMGMYFEDFDEEARDECWDSDCLCECHDDERDDMGLRYEHGVMKDFEEDPPYIRKGVFPFLRLPGEIRDKIYGYAFLQDGNRRESPGSKHRGTIHTALLSTCCQVYKEAGHLPLSLNKLNFSSALYGIDFLGFSLVPTQIKLVTSIHIEFFYHEFNAGSWNILLRELEKLPISHLTLTIKGGYGKEALLGHKCFANRLKSHLKELKTLDVVLGSGMVTKKVKAEIQEELREALIQGYKRPKQSKSKNKRNATSGKGDLKKNSKKAKKASVATKYQTKLVHSPNSSRLGIQSSKLEREAAELTRQSLMGQYENLKQYALSLDLDATPVKIRLDSARKAAESSNASEFGRLAHDISTTLEKRYEKIVSARKNIPTFQYSPPPVTSSHPASSTSSDDWEESTADTSGSSSEMDCDLGALK